MLHIFRITFLRTPLEDCFYICISSKNKKIPPHSLGYIANPIRPRLLRHTLTRVMSIWLKVHKSETVQHISSKTLHRYSQAFQYTFQSKINKKDFKVPPELNINWCAHIKFLLFQDILIQFASVYFDSDLVNLTQSPYIKNRSTHFHKTLDLYLQPS